MKHANDNSDSRKIVVRCKVEEIAFRPLKLGPQRVQKKDWSTGRWIDVATEGTEFVDEGD